MSLLAATLLAAAGDAMVTVTGQGSSRCHALTAALPQLAAALPPQLAAALPRRPQGTAAAGAAAASQAWLGTPAAAAAAGRASVSAAVAAAAVRRALFSMVNAVVEAVVTAPPHVNAKVRPAATAAGMVLTPVPAHADTLC